MKKTTNFYLLYLLIFTFTSCADTSDLQLSSGWEQLPEIIQQIQPPQIPDTIYNVIDYGAVPDSEFDNRSAFNNAIAECSENGGGTVNVPAGTYMCNGSIILKSNVNFHLEDNVVIKFGTNPQDYLPVVFTRWEGVECYNYSPLIYAYEQINIAVTGNGVFDGQANDDNWWAWKGKSQHAGPNQSDPDSRPRLMEMNMNDVPVAARQFGEGYYLRPNFIQPYKCKNILIEGVTFIDSPMWFIHPVLCENISIINVTTKSIGPNTDGCDPESCKNVLIKGCTFSNGDDCIAIKSGRNNDGRRLGIPSENIIVQDCMMKDGHGGVVMGSEISGGVKNVFVENCEMDSPELDRAIRLKSNTYRGGTIENIFVRNVQVGEVREAVLKMNMLYAPAEGEGGNYLPVMKNVLLENITSKKSKYALALDGLESSPVENIIIKDCRFEGVESGKSILNNVGKLVWKNTYVNGEKQ